MDEKQCGCGLVFDADGWPYERCHECRRHEQNDEKHFEQVINGKIIRNNHPWWQCHLYHKD